MKSRIDNSKAAAVLKAKKLSALDIIRELQLEPLAEHEFEDIQEPVSAAKRLCLTVNVTLTPLQLRALTWIARWTTVTIEEMVAQAIAHDLDGVNSMGMVEYQACLYGAVIDQFPERAKALDAVCGAYNDAVHAEDAAGRLRVKMMEEAVVS